MGLGTRGRPSKVPLKVDMDKRGAILFDRLLSKKMTPHFFLSGTFDGRPRVPFITKNKQTLQYKLPKYYIKDIKSKNLAYHGT